MAGSPGLSPDFREFVALLDRHEVRYLVVGGYAVAFHGHPRYTKDIDVWILSEPGNIDRLMAGLRVRVIGLDDLKYCKSVAGRPQDLADIAILESNDDRAAGPNPT